MQGVIIKDTFQNRDLLIYLPPSYKQSAQHYPAVYIHDRGDIFDPEKSDSLKAIEKMMINEELPELILIGVASPDRNDEYTPFVEQNLWEPEKNFGGNGKVYAAYLATELKPYIDQRYRTKPDVNSTGLMGKSLGGLISIYTAYLQPDTFGKIGSISGSFWFKGIVEFMKKTSIENVNRRIYMDVGSTEGVGRNNLQKYMVPRNKEAYETLLNGGFTPKNIRFITEEGGTHSHTYFTKRFPDALKWLFETDS